MLRRYILLDRPHMTEKNTEGSNKMQMRSCDGQRAGRGRIMRANTIKDSEAMALKTSSRINENFFGRGSKVKC